MNDETPVTAVLKAWGEGDEAALEDLVSLVYGELKKRCERALSRERANHTLVPTALLNEVYLRLAGLEQVSWDNRGAFFGFAARLMRQVLVEHARAFRAIKRGGKAQRVDVDLGELAGDRPEIDVLILNDVLEQLEEHDPRMVRIIELRFFAGMTERECAQALEVSRATVQREWRVAKRWLAHVLAGGRDGSRTVD